MKKRRAIQIRELIRKNDTNILLHVRKKFGEATKNMDSTGIYRAAKRLYNEGKLLLPNLRTKKWTAKHANQMKPEEN